MAIFAGIILIELYKKNMFIWLLPYIIQKLNKKRKEAITRHIIFCFVDHYEPMWGKADYETEVRRVDRWCEEYKKLASKHKDADNIPPKHTFFYPEEEYRKEHLDKLCLLCEEGYGEIEVHLHHDNDTEEGLCQKITGFTDKLYNTHGALVKNEKNKNIFFAFIHGNWCLDNSRKDGRWCGVNNELIILKRLGCYADFTFPSAPSETQPKMINTIYYATDDPNKPKSYNVGVPVEVGVEPSGDLMIVQGPLELNWKNRKWGLLPRIENSDIRKEAPPLNERVDLWVNSGISVKGKEEWIFIKVHTHGTQERDMDTLLGAPTDNMFTYLEEKYNDGSKYVLHYVTAREMYNIIKAAEEGMDGNPNQYRDHVVPSPYS